MKIRKLLGMMVIAIFAVGFLVACDSDESTENGDTDISEDANGGSEAGAHAFVFKNTGNPFGERMQDGFQEVIEAHGGEAILRSPEQPTVEGQIQIIEQLMAQDVASITIAGNDFDALQPVLERAMDQGIYVISADSAVNPDSRMVHINQANAERIGQVLISGMSEMLGGEGQFAILSATSQAANQNLWIEYMQAQLELPEFAGLELVTIAFGDDLRDVSVSETEALLLSYPDLRGIIAPTTVGIAAASLVITDQDLIGEVYITGLGLPSEMAAFVNNGASPWMYLWNPIEVGNVAAYTVLSLTDGEITGSIGDSFEAGDFGTLEVIEDGDGTQIMLGDPFRFDADNIDEWAEVY